MRDIQKERFPHPLAPFLDPLGVTRRAESSSAAREHAEPLLPAVGTSDAGESAARIAAVEITLDHLLDDRPEKTILPFETVFIFGQEPLEMMEKRPVETGPLRMSRTIGSPHGRREAPGNGPTSRIRSALLEKTSRAQARRQPALTLDQENGNGGRQSRPRRSQLGRRAREGNSEAVSGAR